MTKIRLWTLALCLGALVLVGVAVPSLAGDTSPVAGSDKALDGDKPTLVFPNEEVKRAPPGGTVQMDVVIKSDGGTGDIGVKSITLVTEYDPAVLELRDFEPKTWLEGDGNTEVQTETATDEESGNLTIEQWRDPPKNGTTGTKLFATLTFDIREDASETNTTVAFQGTSVELIQDYSMYVYETNATIVVDEDAEDPGKNLELDEGDDDTTGGQDDQSGADGSDQSGDDSSDESDDDSAEESDDESDSESRFAGPVLWVVLAGTAGVLVAGTLVWRRRN
jgi:hypothetical protein